MKLQIKKQLVFCDIISIFESYPIQKLMAQQIHTEGISTPLHEFYT